MGRAGVMVGATGFGLAALGWCLRQADGATSGAIAPVRPGEDWERSAGLMMLGLAMLAIGLAFHWAGRHPAPARPVLQRPLREFRRGFAEGAEDAPLPVEHRPVVVASRRSVRLQAPLQPETPPAASLSAGEVERLQGLLKARMQELHARRSVRRERGSDHDLPAK